MFNFNDFEVISYQPTGHANFDPTLTINQKNIMFSSMCFTQLNAPKYVRFMLDTKGKRIAVQGVNDKGSDTVMINPKKKYRTFGIYGCDIISEIRHIMSSWKDNERYKIQGEYFEEENVLLFKMKEAVIFEGGTNNHDSRLNK